MKLFAFAVFAAVAIPAAIYLFPVRATKPDDQVDAIKEGGLHFGEMVKYMLMVSAVLLVIFQCV